MPQEPDRRADETVAAFIARRTGVAEAQVDLDEATDALAAGVAGADDGYATALDRWLNLGGADLEERAAKVIAGLGLRVELDRPTTGLSGGQAARANLASLLLSRYDVFLLDEPTNDLDIAGLEILEDFVRKLRAATVLVSHDREFLQRTVDRVLELDLAQQQTRLFGGGYAGYLEERETARRHAREPTSGTPETRATLEGRRAHRDRLGRQGRARGQGKAPDNDKIRMQAQISRSEKLAARSRPRSGCSTGSMWSRSRARTGSCTWRSPPRRAPGRWPRSCGKR